MADQPKSLQEWEAQYKIEVLDPAENTKLAYNAEEHKETISSRYWASNPRYFQNVHVSAIALLKMCEHAESGGELEVMGMMTGYINKSSFVITDAFPLPVQGTETRVNAHEEANEYMVQYLTASQKGGRAENIVGWYHSHPGYGCWLSGIDVDTQKLQQFTDPFVAVVIDPLRSRGKNKVEIGAFRTFPESAVPPNAQVANPSKPPTNDMSDEKAQIYGAHAHKYYKLDVSYFKSTVDDKILEELWKDYWIPTLIGNDTHAAEKLALENEICQMAESIALGPGRSSRTHSQKAVATGLTTLKGKNNQLLDLMRETELATETKKALFGGLSLGKIKKGM